MIGVLLLGGVGTLVATSGGGGHPAVTTTRPATVDPEDVAAARACVAFSAFVDAAIKGSVPQDVYRRFVDSANALLAGARAGQPAPKWAALGSNLLSVGDDILHDNTAALRTDDLAATQQCDTIPPAAARAGGYRGPPARP